jgi:hypothetical protein
MAESGTTHAQNYRFFLSSGMKKTTEHTEDTENYLNSVISESSVVDNPYFRSIIQGN